MKRKIFTVFLAVCAATCLCFGLSACGGGEDDMTYTVAVSETAYDSAEDAAIGFLAEEISGFAFTAEFSSYTAEKILSEKEISALEIGAEYSEGLLSVEEGTVTFKKERSDLLEEWFAWMFASQLAVAPSVVDDYIDEFYSDLNFPQDNQTQVYLLNYGTYYRFCAPSPANGETLCASYYNSFFVDESYLNCTVETEYKSEDGTVYYSSLIKSTEAGFYQTIGMFSAIEFQPTELVYQDLYGFLMPNENGYSENILLVYPDDDCYVSPDYTHTTLISRMLEPDYYVPFDHSCYIKTQTGFELESNVSSAERFRYGYTKENFRVKEIYTVSKGRIARYEETERIGEGGYTKSVSFSKFGSTKLDIPDEVRTAVEHTHTYSENWTYDATYHWHECTASGYCNALEKDIAVHTFENGVCTDCGYLKIYDWLTFTLSSDGTYYIVRDCANNATEVIIPSTYNGKPVATIDDWAFEGCRGLTSIIIPDGVTSIGDRAFEDCSGLTEVTIGNGVTSIGKYAFSGCSKLTSIKIPNGVTSIGGCAFYGCTRLTNITIPNSVTSIGNQAFEGCSGLTKVTIGNGVTSIDSSAFYQCTSLTNVVIPDSVTSIGDYAFGVCTSLTSVTIGNGVTSIGKWAFYNCTSLTSVTFENTSGWWYADDSDATSGTSISSADLADPATAATYLKSTYDNYYWKRSEN